MVLPIQGYFDSVRRAGMTDAADTALRRVAYELRSAVPNTVRITAAAASSLDYFLEFVPAKDGGRYRAQLTAGGAGNLLDGTAPGDTAFDVLGPNVAGASGDFLVVFNTGQTGLSVYEGCGAAATTNCRTLNAAVGATVSFGNTAAYPPFDSPSQRFQIVPSTGPVSFACEGVGTVGGNGTGTLRRYTGYGLTPSPQPVAFAVAGNLLAEFISACAFTYAPINAANGLVTLRLTMQREGESVSLVHQIHVDNAP